METLTQLIINLFAVWGVISTAVMIYDYKVGKKSKQASIRDLLMAFEGYRMNLEKQEKYEQMVEVVSIISDLCEGIRPDKVDNYNLDCEKINLFGIEKNVWYVIGKKQN